MLSEQPLVKMKFVRNEKKKQIINKISLPTWVPLPIADCSLYVYRFDHVYGWPDLSPLTVWLNLMKLNLFVSSVVVEGCIVYARHMFNVSLYVTHLKGAQFNYKYIAVRCIYLPVITVLLMCISFDLWYKCVLTENIETLWMLFGVWNFLSRVLKQISLITKTQ